MRHRGSSSVAIRDHAASPRGLGSRPNSDGKRNDRPRHTVLNDRLPRLGGPWTRRRRRGDHRATLRTPRRAWRVPRTASYNRLSLFVFVMVASRCRSPLARASRIHSSWSCVGKLPSLSTCERARRRVPRRSRSKCHRGRTRSNRPKRLSGSDHIQAHTRRPRPNGYASGRWYLVNASRASSIPRTASAAAAMRSGTPAMGPNTTPNVGPNAGPNWL